MPDDEIPAGSRVVLRTPRIGDAEELFARLTSDPDVTRYLSWLPHRTVDETRRVITELFNVGADHTWLVTLRNTGEVVGEFGYRRPQAHTVELGYCLARRWWGHGLMSEVLAAVLAELRRDPLLFRVSAACHVDNIRSAQVLERAGLASEGRLARWTMFPNISPEPQDCLMYALAIR